MAQKATEVKEGIRIQLLATRRSPLRQEIAAFLVDRQARGLSARTIEFYAAKLELLAAHLEGHERSSVEEITADDLRSFMVAEARNRSPGGVHALYRAARAFFLWWETETEPNGWRNPIKRTAAPRVPEIALEPVNLDHLQAILGTCKRATFTGDRDRALILGLFDTGCRASEYLCLRISDLDMQSGTLLLRKTKGKRPRAVYVGRLTLREIVRYLRHRPSVNPADPLWVGRNGAQLRYPGLVSMLRRRACAAGSPVALPHSFRRGFAIAMLRGGADVVSLSRLLGHADLSVLRRYLKQAEGDLRRVHDSASPVDQLHQSLAK